MTVWENQSPTFVAKLRSLPKGDLPRICAITVGELEAGHRITKTSDQARRDAFTKFIVEHLHPFALPLTITTRFRYADIIERLWAKHKPPLGGAKRTEMHLVSLGIDINDVWIVAVAWEHNLTLLTSDKMEKIREVIPDVAIENWT